MTKSLTFCLSLLLAISAFELSSTRAVTVKAPPAAAANAPAPCTLGTFKSSRDTVPANWNGPKFQLSQTYPQTLPPAETLPWATIDFKTNPKAYALALRDYVFQGNIDPANPNKPWVVQNNTVRKWYHAPWMDFGSNGREFISGLTRELTSVAGQLAPNPPQSQQVQNWAVGFYNARGGFIFGKVWCDPTNPSLSGVTFPEGTVSGKLLFTAAPVTQVPFLAGTVQWKANIKRNATSIQNAPTVRLLQIDLAVRDSRNTATGWVFATLIYDSTNGSSNPWENMQPVGLMWGNDPGVTPASGTIQQSWLNPATKHLMQHYGWAERLNGPVDNPMSSCLSCHATAGWPTTAMVPPSNATNAQRLPWFVNTPAAQPFKPNQVSHDYSLQLTFGIRQFKTANPGGGGHMLMAGPAAPVHLPVVNRAGESEAAYQREVLRELAKRRRRARNYQ